MSAVPPLLVGMALFALFLVVLLVVVVRERRRSQREEQNRKRPGPIDRHRLRRAKRINR